MKEIIKKGKLYPQKNCPFCSAASEVKTEKDASGKRLYYVECPQCKARTKGYRLFSEAVKHWDSQIYDTRQKKGEWLCKKDDQGAYIECSECGLQVGYAEEEDPHYIKYCSECGAKLIVTQQIGERKIPIYDQIELAERIKVEKNEKARNKKIETYRRQELAEDFLRRMIGVEDDDEETEATW